MVNGPIRISRRLRLPGFGEVDNEAREVDLRLDAFLKPFIEEYRIRRDLITGWVKDIPGLTCDTPDGAFYLFADCSGVIGATTPGGKILATDGDFALYLLERAGVAVVAGDGFLASPFIRISYASSREDLTLVAERIREACQELRR